MQPKSWLRVFIAMLLIGSSSSIFAQNPAPNPGLTRTTLAQADLSVPGRESVVMRVELAPGTDAGWHTHPGEEISYIAEGAIKLSIAGQPTRTVSAGQALIVPAGAVHDAKNEGTTPAVIIAVYVVEKGKPLRTTALPPAH